LRSYDGKKVAATFFGAMEQGNPKVGVVEDRDGLLIGRFAPGEHRSRATNSKIASMA
jgi:hypothetical protein